MNTTVLVRTSRPSFLILAPASVFLGAASAHAAQQPVDLALAALILFGAVAAHVSVNVLNEYHDFRSGLDEMTTRTPFSGGSGALPKHPGMADAVLRFAIVMLILTAGTGLYLMIERSYHLLPIGLLGILVILTYSPWLNRSPMLCLIAPGLGFGFLIVTGTYVALTGEYDWKPLLLSLPPFFLVNNLLLLNQYPDIHADRKAGRRHFPIRHGTEISNLVYALFGYSAYALIALYVLSDVLPVQSLAALAPALFTVYAFRGALRHEHAIGDYPAYLAANVAAAVLTPLLLGISLLIA